MRPLDRAAPLSACLSRLLSRFLYALSALSALSACDEPPPPRAAAVRSCLISVRLHLNTFPTRAGVAGDFNGYDAARAPLSLLDAAEGLWGVDLRVSPGEHLYGVEVDGRLLLDEGSPLTGLAEGGPWAGEELSMAIVGDCGRGRWYRVAREGVGEGLRFTLAYERAEGAGGAQGAPLDPSSLRVEVRGEGPQGAGAEWAPHPYSLSGEVLTLSARGLSGGKYWLRLTGVDVLGAPSEPFEAPFWVEEARFQWEQGALYQVVVDRFSPPAPQGGFGGSPTLGERWGGRLEGVTAALEAGYFEALGVRALWLSPLYANPQGLWRGVEGGEARYEGYHGYWPVAARGVGEEWGGDEALERLVRAAHARGVRVVLDVVLNHVHERHEYVSAHPEWFSPRGCVCGGPGCAWGDQILSCQFTEYLPDVRWSQAALRRQVEDALWWVERFGLDGLRVDAVPMMPRRVVRLLTAELHRRFEGLGVRHLLLGETFTGATGWSQIAWSLGPSGLDGQFDFPFMWALRAAVAEASAPLWALVDAWLEGERAWGGSASVMGRFVGNHDVSRFLSVAAGQPVGDPWGAPPAQPVEEEPYLRLAFASSLVLLLPGVPVLFYGDEVGLAGAGDPDNRRPFWPLEVGGGGLGVASERLFGQVSSLARLRAGSRALGSLALRWLEVGGERLAFVRGRCEVEGCVVVVAWRSPEGASAPLRLPDEVFGWFLAKGGARELVSGERVELSEGGVWGWGVGGGWGVRILGVE